MQDAVSALGLKMFNEADLAPIIDRVVAANKQQIEKLGERSLRGDYGRCNEGSARKSLTLNLSKNF